MRSAPTRGRQAWGKKQYPVQVATNFSYVSLVGNLLRRGRPALCAPTHARFSVFMPVPSSCTNSILRVALTLHMAMRLRFLGRRRRLPKQIVPKPSGDMTISAVICSRAGSRPQPSPVHRFALCAPLLDAGAGKCPGGSLHGRNRLWFVRI